MKEIKTTDDFKGFLNGLKGLGVVHFWAEWAAQCEQMEGVLEELSKDPKLKDVEFVRVIAESVPEVSMEYKIIAVPTVVLLKNKQTVDRIDGANAAELTKKVRMQAERVGLLGTDVKSSEPKEDLTVRLQRLTNMAPAVLFMKGNPEQPRCGFSKQVIALLNSLNAQYTTFDILQDEEVRQGLKTFSNWPTYPQMYVKGELIGGLDIMKEMKESGELAEMLPKKQDLNGRLKDLTNTSPVMVFMKGSPQVPKCGFSRTLMGILQNTGAAFDTFDILEDEEVRQGLKTYSNWPTYPQVYVKGELIGGLDIIKELEESGELVATLKG